MSDSIVCLLSDVTSKRFEACPNIDHLSPLLSSEMAMEMRNSSAQFNLGNHHSDARYGLESVKSIDVITLSALSQKAYVWSPLKRRAIMAATHKDLVLLHYQPQSGLSHSVLCNHFNV